MVFQNTIEQMIKYYSIYFNTYILRLFTIYGPKQKDKLIPNIIDKINQFSEYISK